MMKWMVHYQSDAEPGCSIRQQNHTTIGDVAGPVEDNYQPPGDRDGVRCQPLGQRGEGSDSAKDSQSGYKEADHSEDNRLSNDRSEKNRF